MDFKPLEAGQLCLGEAVKFDVYDSRGRLLLRKGSTIASLAQEDRLAEQGLYVDEEVRAAIDRGQYRKELVDARPVWVASFADRKVSVVEMLASAQQALGVLLAERPASGFDARVMDIVDLTRKAGHLDPDAVLGCIVVQREHPYAIRHQVDTAVLCSLILESVGTPDDVVREVVAAALTMNVSMLEIQQFLYSQKTPLDSLQNATVRTHPLRGVRALQSLGIARPHWLEVVAQHHERIDGTGYPMSVRGDALCLGARVIGLADHYCTLVSERSYRDGLNPAVVCGKFRQGQAAAFDPDIVAALLRLLGVYPPGSVVHLAGGQVGIVSGRTQQAKRPTVVAWLSPQGMRYETGRKRATSDPMSAVDSAMPQGALKPLPQPAQLWAESFDIDFTTNAPAAPAPSAAPAAG